MSFSKARLQRFNELTSEAPPPGSYDPKFENRVKSFAIEKSERFHESKSVTSSGAECNLSVSSKGNGTLPSPKFRTPQLPKKRLVTNPRNAVCPKAKTKLVLGSAKDLKYDVRDELADLRVECANKDKTISEHAKQIEDMKKETWRLEKEIGELNAKQTEIEERNKNDLESMAKLQQEIQDSRDRKHAAEVESLRSQLDELVDMRQRELLSEEANMEDLRQRYVVLLEQSTKAEEEFEQIRSNVESEFDRLKEISIEARRTTKLKIDELSFIVAQKDDELSKLRTELDDLKDDSEKLREQFSRRDKDRENEINFFKNEDETLRAEIRELTRAKIDLETKLETRQQVIMQLQSQLSTLQCEVDELRAEYERLVGESETRTKTIVDRHEREIIDVTHEFMRERDSLQRGRQDEIARRLELECENRERADTNAFLTEELQDVQQLYKNTSRRLMETQEKLEATNKIHSDTVTSHRDEIKALRNKHEKERSELENLLEKTRIDYLRELDNMTEARNNELKAVKDEAERTVEDEKRRVKERTDRIVENAEAVTRETLAACRSESEERVKRIIADSDAKVKAMVKDARKIVEEEMREAADRYDACLARVESEKASLEEKLARRDAEIVELSVTLDELKIVNENQESFSQSLQADLDRVEAELAERKAELRALKDQIRSEAAEMVARRRRFEVVMEENQASVAALSQRLWESDAEVERLQNELKTGEDSIHEHRGLLSAMRNTSKILGEELYNLMKQLDENKGRFDKLEEGNLAEIESLRSLFFAEIDGLKHISAMEMTRLEEECRKKDEQNETLKNHLDAMARKLNEAREVMLKFEELEDTRLIEIGHLELDKEKLVRELKLKTKMAEDSRALLETWETERKLALEEADKRVAQLTSRIADLEMENTEVKKLRGQREQQEKKLSEEIQRRRDAEDETKKLSEDCDDLRKSYQEVSDKYAEMIGHHNHKQRVKHLNQLKEKIIRLEKDVETKKHVIEQQTKTIEKLKIEEKRSFAKGKENLHSHGISRSPYTTPASSPMKPLTPLRERNE